MESPCIPFFIMETVGEAPTVNFINKIKEEFYVQEKEHNIHALGAKNYLREFNQLRMGCFRDSFTRCTCRVRSCLKSTFQAAKLGSIHSKHFSITLLPYVPGSNNENFHKKCQLWMLPPIVYHVMKLKRCVPRNSKILPASHTKRAIEEKMHGRIVWSLLA